MWWCPLIFIEENPLNVCRAKHSQAPEEDFVDIALSFGNASTNTTAAETTAATTATTTNLTAVSTKSPMTAPAAKVGSVRDCQTVYLVILAIFSCTFFVYIVACRRFRKEFGRMLQVIWCM